MNILFIFFSYALLVVEFVVQSSYVSILTLTFPSSHFKITIVNCIRFTLNKIFIFKYDITQCTVIL